MGSNICPKCDTTLDENQDSMACCVCELDFCIECANISKILIAALAEDTTDNFKWTCNGCKQNFPCMTGVSQQLKTMEQTTHDQMAINKIETIDKEIRKVEFGLTKS